VIGLVCLTNGTDGSIGFRRDFGEGGGSEEDLSELASIVRIARGSPTFGREPFAGIDGTTHGTLLMS